MNTVQLVGRLTRDVDLKFTQSGEAVANFTIAVNRNFTNQQGEREADFINCVIWRKSAENLANFTRKGSLIGLDGRLQTRSYDNQQGQRVYVTEVVVNHFDLLEKKPENQQQAPQGYTNPYTKPDYAQNAPNYSQAQAQPMNQGNSPLSLKMSHRLILDRIINFLTRVIRSTSVKMTSPSRGWHNGQGGYNPQEEDTALLCLV